MANATITSLGRVQPLYKGEYVHGIRYSLLDNVFYEGSTYVSLVDDNINHYPTDSNYWQIIASKGQRGLQGITGSFGAPVASASVLDAGSNPTVNVSATGPDEAKIFNFQFGIPAGPYGFDNITANATSLPASGQLSVNAELDTSTGERILNFDFGIPAADGEGAQSVDGINADINNNISLSAVRYVNQSLSNAQKKIVCTNINAIENPTIKEDGAFLRYNSNLDNSTWIAEKIEEITESEIDEIVI